MSVRHLLELHEFHLELLGHLALLLATNRRCMALAVDRGLGKTA